MNVPVENILNSLEAGDALGAPFSGLSRAHIRNHFPEFSTYIDPSPALKGKLEKWTMPGLYTSISQFTIIAGLLAQRKGIPSGLYLRTIRATPPNPEDDSGIFRFPDYAERSMLAPPGSEQEETSEVSSARIIIPAIILPLVQKNRDSLMRSLVEFMSDLTRNPYNIAGAALLADFIHTALYDATPEPSDFFNSAVESASFIEGFIAGYSGRIFDLKLNPDYLSIALENFQNILKNLAVEKSIQENEEIIIGEVNTTVKTPVTRATVNTPLAVLPFSLAIAAGCAARPENLLFTAASMGGESSPLTSLAGIFYTLTGATDHLSDDLTGKIVNRKRIMSLNASIPSLKKDNGTLDDFISGEAALTAKLISEKNSKQKHRKKPGGEKDKQKKQTRNREEELSRHIVESWTKIDQAKWRKGKRKLDMEQ